MNNPNTMAQQQPRPPYNPRPSYTPPAISPPSYPHSALHYPPQPYNSFNLQQPAPKRVRLSPDAQSPHVSPRMNHQPSPLSANSPNGNLVNGLQRGQLPPGSMGPPSRPADRTEDRDRDFDSVLAGTGINIEEEDRRLTHPTIPASSFYGAHTPNSAHPYPPAGFGAMGSNFYDRPGSGGARDNLMGYNAGQQNFQELTQEEVQRRKEAQADWDAARYSQYPTWDLFLYGEELQKRITKQSGNERLSPLESGLMRPSRHLDPAPTQVNGLAGASRVINQGQTILSQDAGKDLRSMLDLVCLAAKERLTGIVDLSARLALERKQHSQGRVPDEWGSIAAVPMAAPVTEDGTSPASSSPLKRTHSQANAESPPRVPRIAEIFQKQMQADRIAEAARLAKRAKRNAAANPDTALATTPADTPGSTFLDGEKKVTKKDRKLAESKFTEQQQHKSANETARMATSGIMGRIGGKQKKAYSWLQPGGASGTQTPTKATPASASTSTAATPSNERTAAASKEKLVAQWDENKDPGIQMRDILLVLENDGKAPKSYMRGYGKE